MQGDQGRPRSIFLRALGIKAIPPTPQNPRLPAPLNCGRGARSSQACWDRVAVVVVAVVPFSLQVAAVLAVAVDAQVAAGA
jgi:hypothetical protein